MKRTRHNENFPVASRLVQPRHRPMILAFYQFVRTADDIADSAELSTTEKLARLEQLESALSAPTDDPAAEPLRRQLQERGMNTRHACDLLAAFRLDVSKNRYRSWSELMDYCTLSAMPVGRFVLDVHGESIRLWPASDNLCAALQIINHLQDCVDDYRNLDRVYLPLDILAAHGASVDDLNIQTHPGAHGLPPPLRATIASLAEMTRSRLLVPASGFAAAIADLRLSLEVEVIQRLAAALMTRLERGDPLHGNVRLGRAASGLITLQAVLRGLSRRTIGRSVDADIIEARK